MARISSCLVLFLATAIIALSPTSPAKDDHADSKHSLVDSLVEKDGNGVKEVLKDADENEKNRFLNDVKNMVRDGVEEAFTEMQGDTENSGDDEDETLYETDEQNGEDDEAEKDEDEEDLFQDEVEEAIESSVANSLNRIKEEVENDEMEKPESKDAFLGRIRLPRIRVPRIRVPRVRIPPIFRRRITSPRIPNFRRINRIRWGRRISLG